MNAFCTWALARLGEKTSQSALATAILSTATVASELPNYAHDGVSSWMALIPIWAGSLITICLPEAGPVTLPASPLPVMPATAPPVEDDQQKDV